MAHICKVFVNFCQYFAYSSSPMRCTCPVTLVPHAYKVRAPQGLKDQLLKISFWIFLPSPVYIEYSVFYKCLLNNLVFFRDGNTLSIPWIY